MKTHKIVEKLLTSQERFLRKMLKILQEGEATYSNIRAIEEIDEYLKQTNEFMIKEIQERVKR